MRLPPRTTKGRSWFVGIIAAILLESLIVTLGLSNGDSLALSLLILPGTFAAGALFLATLYASTLLLDWIEGGE